MENVTKQAWALDLAGRGFLIFPVQPGAKTPYKGVSWTEIMTTNADTIRKWFDERPSMNYGVCPGEGFVIIDLDVKGNTNGVESFFALEAEQPLDQWVNSTLSVKTPSGGLHLLLSTPHSVGNSHSFGPGIDVRGAGGYVVGPGCELKDGGTYSVVNGTEILAATQWVVSNLGARREKDENAREPVVELDLPSAIDRAREYLKVCGPAIDGDGGDNFTFVVFAELKDLGVSEAKSLELVTEPLFEGGDSWNDRCDGPWDLTGDKSLTTKAYNAFRHGSNPPGDKAASILMDDPDFEIPLADMEASVARFEATAKIRKAVAEDAAVSEILSHMYTDMEITKRDVQREMLIHEWLPAHGFTALLAARGRGKTVTMTDMALKLACDMDWYGVPTAEGWTSIYLCGEDDEGFQDQVTAWSKYHEREPTKGRLRSFDIVFNLLDTANVNAWIKSLKTIIGDDGRAVVFVDTWQRATSKGGQNSDEDMQKALHNAEAFAAALNGPAVVAFHPPKDGRSVILGSSVLENSTTAIWELTNHVAGKRLEVTRMKGRGEGNYRLFSFEEIPLGIKGQFNKDRIGIVPVSEGGKEDEISGRFSETDEIWRVALCDSIRAIYALSDKDKDRPPLTRGYVVEKIEALSKEDKNHPIIFSLNDAGIKQYSKSKIRPLVDRLIVDKEFNHFYRDGTARLLIHKGKGVPGGGVMFEIAAVERVDPLEEDDGLEYGELG